MSKISYPELVKNLADAYRTAIGSTEPIVVGELTAKVTEAMNSGGDCIQYKSITYNTDNTITLIDSEDVEHTMSCTYEDGKITSITLDNEEIKLSYDGDSLIAIEDTVMDLSKTPINSETSNPMFKSNPNAEIFTMFPVTANNNILSDSSFNVNATAVTTEE